MSYMAFYNILFDHGYQPKIRHWSEKYFRLRILQSHSLLIKPTSFQEKSMNITSLFWVFVNIEFIIIVIDNLEVKRECINGNCFLSSIILFGSSEEWLSEIEPWNPKVFRCPFVDPFIYKVQSFDKIFNISTKWLKRWIGVLQP